MKIKEEFYVLVKLRNEEKDWKLPNDTKETLFVKTKDGKDTFVNDVREATRYMNKQTVFMCLRDYEEKHGYESSGLTPLLVTSELTY